MQLISLDNKRSANRYLLAACILFIVSSLMSMFFAFLPLNITIMILTLTGEIIAIGIPALIFMKKHGGLQAFGFKRLNFKIYVRSFFMGMAMAYFAGGINLFLQAIWDALGIGVIDTNAALDLGGGLLNFIILFLCVALIPAIVEEAMFRGALLFSYTPWSHTRALFHTALLFALLHGNPQALPVYIVMGLLLAVVTLKCGSVFPAMIMHFANNLLPVLVLGLLPHNVLTEALAETPQVDVSTGTTITSAVFAFAIGGLAFWLLFRGFKRAVAQREAADYLLNHPLQPAGVAAEEETLSAVTEEKKAQPPKSAGRVALISAYILLIILNAAMMIYVIAPV